LAETDIVDIESLTIAYDARPVLKGVNLKIRRGQVVAIMGGSDCGKTTLLRIIGGALSATDGSTRVLDWEMRSLSRAELYSQRRRMGMLFQFGALFTDKSVFGNVAFQTREHTDLPEELIRDLVLMKLDAVGLRGAAQLMPSALSGEVARHVVLARVVALDPTMITYHEPFAGLDPISLGVIARLIRRLDDSLGATFIIVAHDVQESLHSVDCVYFVSEGRVVAEWAAQEVRRSDHRYVRQFINGEPDGPVAFHCPAPLYVADLDGARAA
jgi:phospholipid/cholesterol/gamma-HCH transport system ATP-binding protein